MTIKEIAKLAGVSISTVSKIVNNKDQNINADTRNRVLEVVKEYNYTPYGTVKSISCAKTFLLGVLLKNSKEFSHTLQGIVSAAQAQGYGIILFDSGNSYTAELKHITSLCKNKIDGLLWEPVGEESLLHEHYFSDADIPTVLLNYEFGSAPFIIDYQRLGYLCTEKLLQQRHTQIGCLMKENSTRSLQVLEGVKNCLFDNQLPLHDGLEVYASSPSCIPLLTSGRLSAIVGSEYDETLLLYRQLNRLHMDIPGDVSLLTIYDAETAPPYPSLSGFFAPHRELGYTACRHLIQLCEKTEEAVLTTQPLFNYRINHEESLHIPASCRGKKFAVLGSINVDVTLNVDGFPETGKSTLITNSYSCAGGKGTNQTIGASRLGHEAVVIGKVGNDADASIIFQSLDENTLSAEGIYKDPLSQTGKAYVYVQKDGEVTITYIPGANQRLTAEDIRSQSDLFEGCEYLLLSMDIPMEAAMEAASLAKKKGLITILKPSALSALPDVFYKTTQIFIPNRSEATTFCPRAHTVEEQAEFFYSNGMPIVIITLGNEGCYVRTKDIKKQFPAAPFSAVDATGGADAFICALAVHLSDGFSLENSVQIAQYAAGFCVSRQGVTTALIDKDTLYAHIRLTAPELLERI